MKDEFEARIILKRLPLTLVSRRALDQIDRYDAIIFTSKNAEAFFNKEMLGRSFSARIIRVGPRRDLLKFDLKGKRILFPRSALAPADIVRQLRKRGAIVRTVTLYSATGAALSATQKRRLLGETRQLYFKSPSGIYGLLRQFRGTDRKRLLSIPARCIGETTAKAARDAGFRKVFIK